MWIRLTYFVRRCWLTLKVPSEGAAEVLGGHTYLGGILFNWVVTIFFVRWVGEALWPAWCSLWGYLAVATVAAVPAAALATTATHVLARIFGGRGSWLGMLALGGYAALPICIFGLSATLGASLWVRLFGPISLHLATLAIFLLVTASVLLLGLLILRGAVGVNYGLSRGRAWATVLLTALLLTIGQSLVGSMFVAKCRVSLANINAMSSFPTIFDTSTEYDAVHFQIELSANRAYLRKLPIERGSAMLFRSETGEAYLARLLALPGETVELRRGRLYVNGQEHIEPWRKGEEVNAGPYVLGEADYFLWTDDRRSAPRLLEAENPLGVIAHHRLIGPPMFLDQMILRRMFPPQPISNPLQQLSTGGILRATR